MADRPKPKQAPQPKEPPLDVFIPETRAGGQGKDGKRSKPYGCGVFKGPGDVARNVDRYLAETGFGKD